ncbi:nucleotidyltransferase family protein [Deltaproteobacteria bacterium OttesenSCG-928-M10]|nr:nucleotidyltransferase family protein [Deltaproteobacteria bacterium OttesenSCG-928-M10]
MIGAVILAGGRGSRAGGPKIIWEFEGIPAVRRVAEAALAARRVDRVAVVTGAWPDEVREALAGLPLIIDHNPHYAQGQAESLKAGLTALGDGLRAVIFLLADQPFITSQIIDDLVEFYQASGCPLAAPVVAGKRVNPVLFDLGRFQTELMRLSGDEGGRSLMTDHASEAGFLDMNDRDPLCFQDFDTREEYSRLL